MSRTSNQSQWSSLGVIARWVGIGLLAFLAGLSSAWALSLQVERNSTHIVHLLKRQETMAGQIADLHKWGAAKQNEDSTASND